MKMQLTQDSKPEFIGQIIDIFEDYLAEHEIILESKERNDAIEDGDIEPEEAAILYGDYYDMIGDTISCAVENHSLMNGPLDNAEKQNGIVEIIMDSFYDVLDAGMYKEGIPAADAAMLKSNVHGTFEKWGLFPENK